MPAVTQIPSKPMSQKQTRKVRGEVTFIATDISTEHDSIVNITQKYYDRLSTEETHHQCHPTKGAMGLSQWIHPLVCKIQELVSVGITNVVEVQRLLRHHVYKYMCTDNPHDQSYHPAVDSNIFRAKQALKLSIIDQENALKKIAQWKEISLQYFFRPYRNASKHENGNGNEDGNSEEHREEWWQWKVFVGTARVIATGADGEVRKYYSLMDATYKTTHYELPLSFISVRTNLILGTVYSCTV